MFCVLVFGFSDFGAFVFLVVCPPRGPDMSPFIVRSGLVNSAAIRVGNKGVVGRGVERGYYGVALEPLLKTLARHKKKYGVSNREVCVRKVF